MWLEKLCLEKVGAIALIKPSFIAIVQPFNLHLMKQINHGRNLKSKAFDGESENAGELNRTETAFRISYRFINAINLGRGTQPCVPTDRSLAAGVFEIDMRSIFCNLVSQKLIRWQVTRKDIDPLGFQAIVQVGGFEAS